ncbi:MAG: endonuclease MutS2 [Oscillospiraceae bacterium]|nr:endonuclease MutS2 [Oscillospiraceae bacterium]
MDLYEKSLQTIELPAILDLLSEESVSEAAKGAARELRPVSAEHTVKKRLAETSSAKSMLSHKGSPAFSGVKDIRAAVKRADVGGMLNTRELLDIAGVLRAASSAIAYAKKETDAPGNAIDYLFSSLVANKYLEDSILAAIISEEEIADRASTELAAIRRHMRLAGEKIRQTLNKIISSPTHSKALQEPIITMKNGRYVVPVKAEQKSAIPGLVHEISSSGATQFIEPMAVVQINNELRELEAKEKREIERILSALSAEAADGGEDIVSDFEILAELDLIFAKAKLSAKMNAHEPEISQEMSVNLKNARHPLLPEKSVVPIDICIGSDFNTLVITGPNTGGKTVALKTLGLLCAMSLCGMHIPVDEGSEVPIFSNILADIGDEQSIEQSLSTFSSHMTNITAIISMGGYGSLMLFDEMGAGTDPVEGAALAIAIIEHARGKGALIAASTHYAELKIFAMTAPGVANASCEFDVATLKPTYRLITGIPGKSNAFAISRRLGLPEAVIEDAAKRVDHGSASFEDAIASLEESRLSLEAQRDESARLLREAEIERRYAEEVKKRIDGEAANASDAAKREAAKILEGARRTAEAAMEELRLLSENARKETDSRSLNEGKAEIFRALNEAEKALGAEDHEPEEESSREPVRGDKVKLRGLGATADVISVDRDGMLTLQAGIMKITARADEVILIEDAAQQEVKKQIAKTDTRLSEIAAKPEIDLRGMQTDEAVPTLERYLDNARMAHLVSVTVIHGKGTGALRQAVHRCLRGDKKIKSFRLGLYGEGEDGVTVVEFAY